MLEIDGARTAEAAVATDDDQALNPVGGEIARLEVKRASIKRAEVKRIARVRCPE
jgi:hypothetical protein